MRIPIVNRFTCSYKQLDSFIKNIKGNNITPILDYANENYTDFNNNYKKTRNIIEKYPNNVLAIKLSSFNVKNDKNFAEKKTDSLIDLAIQNNSKILIDAEDYEIQENINNISDNMMVKYNKDKINVYKTYQMYRNDTFDIFKNDIQMSRNYKLGCKLVRGAYYNQDKKYGILFDNIEETHQNYNNAIKLFLKESNKNDMLMCATHNNDSINLASSLDNSNRIEYAQLLGMSDKLSNQLVKDGKTVYKYLPFGNFSETLPYLIRRLYENYPMIMKLFS